MDDPRSGSRERFAALLARPTIPLAEAALAVALEEYPHLDTARHLSVLDALAANVAARLSPARTVADSLRQLRTVLFEQEGFRGNAEHYYDPRNSFLNEVLDRRLGIPITLSIVYLEVAARIGLEAHGVAFPGHFLVRCGAGGRDVFIDPFHGGEVLSADECVERLRARAPGGELDLRHLEPVGTRQILARLLHNLKKIYVEAGDDVRALWVIDRLVQLVPDHPHERRDRGLVAARLGHAAAATRDLAAYLSAAPAAPDRHDVEELLAQLRGKAAYLN